MKGEELKLLEKEELKSKKNDITTWYRYGVMFGFILGIILLKIIVKQL